MSFRWCRFYFFVQVEWKATTVQTAVSVNRSVIWISVCLPLAVAPVMEVAFLFGLKSHCWACQASFQVVIWCSLTQPLHFLESVLHMLELLIIAMSWQSFIYMCRRTLLFTFFSSASFLGGLWHGRRWWGLRLWLLTTFHLNFYGFLN